MLFWTKQAAHGTLAIFCQVFALVADRPGEAPRDPQHQLYQHFGLQNAWADSPTLSQADTGMLLLNRWEQGLRTSP